MQSHRPHRAMILTLCLAAGALTVGLWRSGTNPEEVAQKRSGAHASDMAKHWEDGLRRLTSDDRTAGPSLAGLLSRLSGSDAVDAEISPTEPGSAPDPSAPSDPAALQRAVAEFQAGKENAFFSPREAARKLLAPEVRGESVRGMREMLRDTKALKALPRDVRYLTQQPAAATSRMAALDLFFAMVDEDETLIAELAELVTEPLEPGLDDHVARVVMAEKYESMAKLGSLDFAVALRTFLGLSDPQLQAILRPALIEGLASTGISYSEAEAVVDGATLPA